jgi:uncharacterized protein (DUF885 family)
MTPSQQASAALLEWQLNAIVDGAEYQRYTFPFEQRNGIANVILIDSLTLRHPIRSVRDAENYVERLRQVPQRISEAIVSAERRARDGFIPPKFVLLATINQMERFSAPSPSENLFVANLARKAASAKLPANRTNQLTADATSIVEQSFYPAWRRAIDLLKQLGTTASGDAGLWRLPGGDRAYRFFLRDATTTNLSPDEIHELACVRLHSSKPRCTRSSRS